MSCRHPHGRRSRYDRRSCHTPCRCAGCVAAKARDGAAIRRRHREGTPALVDAAPTRDLLRAWVRGGVTLWSVAKSTGVIHQTLYMIASGRQERVTAITADIIAGAYPVPALVSPVGLRRRSEALLTAGFSVLEQARRSGIGGLRGALGRGLVTFRTAQTFAVFYEGACTVDLIGRQASRARAVAARRGYAPPEAWTDDTIDDPDAKPWQGVDVRCESDERDTEIRVERLCEGRPVLGSTIAERRAAVRVLNGRGFSDRLIAERVGIEPRNVLRIRGELGLPAASRAAGAA